MALSPEQPSWLGLGDCGPFVASSDPTPIHLLGSFHAPPQQEQLLNANYFYNAQEFPAVSWSTPDPTILLTDQHHQLQQQQQHQRDSDLMFEMGRGGGNSCRVSCDSTMTDDDIGIDAGNFCRLSSFRNAVHQQQQQHCFSGANDLHHTAVGGINSSSSTAPPAAPMVASESIYPLVRSPDAMSSSSINDFSFCSGGGLNTSPHRIFSLSSDQYYNCSADALLLPKLVSDSFSDSHHKQQQQQESLAKCWQSLHEAESCGSADRDRSTTSAALLQMSSGLVTMLPQQSAMGPFKTHQHRPHALDTFPHVQWPLPASLQWPSEQNHGNLSSNTARYKSLYPGVLPPLTNPIFGVKSTTSASNNASSFYKDFGSVSNPRLPHQHQGMAAVSSSCRMPERGGGIGSGLSEFNVEGRSDSRRDYNSDHLTLFSASQKPTVTSIEPQSVAARHRRKKISERVRSLEKLIPGGNRMDTASMLDEAAEYVKFLQLQVQLLESMEEQEPEPDAPNGSSSTAAPSTMGHRDNSSSGKFYSNSSNKCKIDSSASLDRRLGSSSHVSRSASLLQRWTVAAAAAATTATEATSPPPLILSELLQEQLFRRRLCLVSLSQYCPQRQVARQSC